MTTVYVFMCVCVFNVSYRILKSRPSNRNKRKSATLFIRFIQFARWHGIAICVQLNFDDSYKMRFNDVEMLYDSLGMLQAIRRLQEVML